MRLSMGQELRLVQKQVLAPRMIQSMEILQLPILALQERIDREMQENPILDLNEEDPDLPDESVEKDNPDAHCLPMGHMQFHLHPQPRRIVQTEDLMVIIYEGNAGIREIFLDGRPSPDNDPQPWWYGYSRGEWDGDTLVVTTSHFRDEGWLDVNGSPLTVDGIITERFTRTDYGHIEIVVTIDDPKAYTESFTVKVNHQIMLDTSLIEFVCIENERSAEFYDQD